jgi:hypothetical protein
MHEGAGVPAPAPSPCAEHDCEQPRWSVKRHGELVVVSAFCNAHTNVPLFDMSAAPVKLNPKSAKRLRNDKDKLLSAFHSEVRRRRLGREVQ